VIRYNGLDLIYHIDCTNYSGASGCPIISQTDFGLVGILYENITFSYGKHNYQIPNTCFIISKFIIQIIYAVIDQNNDIVQEHFSALRIFNISDDVLQDCFIFKKFSPKF